jgi:hypothetical protein
LTWLDLGIAQTFTLGHFDYKTGLQFKPQSYSVIAERTGTSEASVKRFFRRAKGATALQETGKTHRFNGGQLATKFYQLTVPAWAKRGKSQGHP